MYNVINGSLKSCKIAFKIHLKSHFELKMQECHTRKSAFNADIHCADKGNVLPHSFLARLNADIQNMQKNCIKTAILCKKQAILGPFYTEYTEMARMQDKPMKCARNRHKKKRASNPLF